ncbi:hypothetical protein [Rhizobium herbae]|uniref:Uncharacterized protein n=1 Tax=Rhizobium herbae TaxID=508661 RepID=A0ABS4EUK4_9HYPH|nr:hypothetical protein [Rhizobium herbae]MBP1861641.1 hypothetical protein [Rhizobium herbae]
MTASTAISKAIASAIEMFSKWWVRDTTFGVLIALSGLLLADSFVEIVLPKVLPVLFDGAKSRPIDYGFGIADGVGLAAFVCAILFKMFVMAVDYYKKPDAETAYLAATFTDPALAQKAHERAFGTRATIPEMEALKAHRDDPLGAQRSRARGGRHVKWNGTWYELRSKRHRLKKGITVALFLLTAVVAVTAFICGCASVAVESHLQAGVLLLESMFMALMAGTYVRDIERYSAAEHLVRIPPGPN